MVFILRRGPVFDKMHGIYLHIQVWDNCDDCKKFWQKGHIVHNIMQIAM